MFDLDELKETLKEWNILYEKYHILINMYFIDLVIDELI